MSAVMSNPHPPQHFVMEGVSWEYYDRTLRQRDAGGWHWRITYDDGRMELVTTGNMHEQAKTAIGRLIEIYALECEIPVTGLGEVTCRLKAIRKGLEPDECYYVSTPAPPSSEVTLDLTEYPPPDLAVEVDITQRSIPRQPIYAALGIGEVWRYRRGKLAVLRLTAEGSYEPAEASALFPDLPMEEFNRCLKIALAKSQHEGVKAMQKWTRGQTGQR